MKFRMAKVASEKSTYSFKLGAVIYKGSRALGTGFNELKSHPRACKQFVSTHAEQKAIISVLRQWNNHLDNCEIYIYREYKNGKPALALPCPMCMELIKKSGITKIYYTDHNSPDHYSVLKL